MFSMKYIIIYLTFILFSSHASAAWYQVEVIVFEHLTPDDSGEQWHSNQGIPDISKSIDLATEPSTEEEGLTAFKALPVGKFKLGGIYRNLKFSKEYRPLTHVAWQQPGISSRSRAKYVHIRKAEGEVINEQVLIMLDSDEQEVNELDISELDINEEEIFQDVLVKVDGTVRLRSGHFLHMDVDLAYFFQLIPASLISTIAEDPNAKYQLTGYTRLKETRKIKLNELHYFDHPLFGAIVWVKRLKI